MVWVGRILKCPLAPAWSSGRQEHLHHSRFLKTPSNPPLNTSRHAASETALGNLCQGLIALRVKNFFLITNRNLSCFSVKPFSLVSPHTLGRRDSPALYQTPLSNGRLPKGLPGAFCPAGWMTPAVSTCLHRRGASALWSSLWPSSGLAPKRSTSFLYWKPHSWMQHSRWDLTTVE